MFKVMGRYENYPKEIVSQHYNLGDAVKAAKGVLGDYRHIWIEELNEDLSTRKWTHDGKRIVTS